MMTGLEEVGGWFYMFVIIVMAYGMYKLMSGMLRIVADEPEEDDEYDDKDRYRYNMDGEPYIEQDERGFKVKERVYKDKGELCYEE